MDAAKAADAENTSSEANDEKPKKTKKKGRAKADAGESTDEVSSEDDDGDGGEPEESEAEAKSKPKKGKGKKEKADKLTSFLDIARKKWPDTIAKANETPFQKIPRISTGNVGLDIATYGGWPVGRISRAFGKEKSGKTGTCLNTVVEWQKHCAVCYERFACDPSCDYHNDEANRPKAPVCWIDAENRLISMWDWVEGHGVDLSRFVVQCPPDGQHIVDFVDSVIREKGAGLGLIIVDSVAHVVSHEEIAKETTKGRTAPVNALLMNKAMRKWTAAILSLGLAERRKPTILLINQLRQTLDQFAGAEVQTGGLGMNYATSLDVRFSSGKYHYVINSPDGGPSEDKVQKFGSKWKPDEHAQPDYVEVNYRVTASGVCPIGRYGQFNYWLRSSQGRHIGDPDNVDRMWSYIKRYDLLKKEGRGYSCFGMEAETQNALKERFFAESTLQSTAWAALVERFISASA